MKFFRNNSQEIKRCKCNAGVYLNRLGCNWKLLECNRKLQECNRKLQECNCKGTGDLPLGVLQGRERREGSVGNAGVSSVFVHWTPLEFTHCASRNAGIPSSLCYRLYIYIYIYFFFAVESKTVQVLAFLESRVKHLSKIFFVFPNFIVFGSGVSKKTQIVEVRKYFLCRLARCQKGVSQKRHVFFVIVFFMLDKAKEEKCKKWKGHL